MVISPSKLTWSERKEKKYFEVNPLPVITFQCLKIQQLADFYLKIIHQRCWIDRDRLSFICTLVTIHKTRNTESFVTLHYQWVMCPGVSWTSVSSLIELLAFLRRHH